MELTERQINYEQWAEVVIDRFQDNINRKDIGFTGDLFDSFEHNVNTSANGNVSLVSFMFNFYGRFVDMGVGRDTPIGNSGDLGYTPRKRKEWFGRQLWFEVQKLSEVLARIYGKQAALTIIRKIEAPKDAKGAYYRSDKRQKDLQDRKNAWQQWQPVQGNSLQSLPLDI